MAELPDLIALTDGDPEWTWDICIVCGSAEIVHRGLHVAATPSGQWQVNRVAWCAAEICQRDRKLTSDPESFGGIAWVNADSDTQGAPS